MLRPQDHARATTLRRRRDNNVPFTTADTIDAIYDFIRMLDDPAYPQAHVALGPFMLHFSRAARRGAGVVADVLITRVPEPGHGAD